MIILELNPLEYLDKIKTPLTLIGFIAAIIFLYLRNRDLQKRKMLGELEDDNKVQSAQIILNDLHIDTSNLTDKQKYKLARQKLKDKARHKMILSALIGFLAIIILIIILFTNSNGNDTIDDNVIDNKQISEIVNYEVRLEVTKDSLIRRKIKDSKEHINSHCQGAQNINWRIPADTLNGWFIDITTIKVSPSLRNECVYNGIFNQSKYGFNLKGVVRNSGECTEILGEVISYDARGKMNLSYSYVEEKKETKKKSFDSEIKGEFIYGEQTEIEIPENTVNFKIFITKQDNSNIVLSNTLMQKENYKISKVGNTKLILQSEF